MVHGLGRFLSGWLIWSAVGGLAFGGWSMLDEIRLLTGGIWAKAELTRISDQCSAVTSVMGTGVEQIGSCSDFRAAARSSAAAGLVTVSNIEPVKVAETELVIGGHVYQQSFRLEPAEVQAVRRGGAVNIIYTTADPADYRVVPGFASLARSATPLLSAFGLLGLGLFMRNLTGVATGSRRSRSFEKIS